MSVHAAYRGEILIAAPHPDDEMTAAAGTSLSLRDAGYSVGVVALSLGRPGQHERRRAEMEAACRKAGFEYIPTTPFNISSGDDLELAQKGMTDLMAELIENRKPELIISPSVHDNHHAHEVVARSVRDAAERSDVATRWWLYGFWGHIIAQTVYSPFGKDTMDEVIDVLGEHVGENARNDYRAMVERGAARDVYKGSETVFGPGSATATNLPYAEIFTEVVYEEGEWNEGQHRTLDVDQPFTSERSGKKVGWWLHKMSDYQIYRDQ